MTTDKNQKENAQKDAQDPLWLNAAVDNFAAFCRTVSALRTPGSGCPWDLQQTHQSLRRYMLEEAYEAANAMGEGRDKDICDELGDVLLQVVLNAQIGADARSFHLGDVIAGIDAKMRRRHPHVFARGEQDGEISVAEIRAKWDQIKKTENPARSDVRKGIFEAAECHKVRPATSQARKIGEVAAKIRFDWLKVEDVFAQFRSEVDELAAEIAPDSPHDQGKIEAEIGDVYFSLAQLCRHLGVEPEVAAQSGNDKFLRRFRKMEKIAEGDGKDVGSLSLGEMENLWRLAKSFE